MRTTLHIAAMSCAGIILCGVVAILYMLPLDVQKRSPVQPIAFSHRVHAGDNGIHCLYCHRYADKTMVAGIPAMSECLACHRYIVPDAPGIRVLNEYRQRGEALPWLRLHTLPDHVYFTHVMHSRAGIDCSICHGNVAQMTTTTRMARLKMGWCLECHRRFNASIDCWSCHI